ncbi:IS110 family transposase [Escherichia coli]|nr:IS110 family transposase [Escherichia coli]HAW7353315.1 IS110 family transposase [Escherichia coli]
MFRHPENEYDWLSSDAAVDEVLLINEYTFSIGFKNRRQLAAWLGLVPRQCFSVGKNTLGSISKRDDVYIRTLLFHGAKTVSNARKGRQVQESWLGRPVSRRNKNVATVALNNKNARVLWVLLTNDKEISPEEVMGAAYM